MAKRLLPRYLASSLLPIIGTIFLTLFMITSIIFSIRIASATAVIKISLAEFIKLYALLVPQILSYTLPLSFFAGTVIGLARLSSDMESIVLFTLGARPKHLLWPLVGSGLLLSVLMLVVTLVLIPMSKYDIKIFMEQKKVDAELNFRPSELGQKFGDWMIFANDKKGALYKDLVLYYERPNEAALIAAKEAQLSTLHGSVALEARQGIAYHLPGSLESDPNRVLTQIEFDSMRILRHISPKEIAFWDILSYWQSAKGDRNRAKDFAVAVMIGAMPFLLSPLALALGIINPRYQKNRSHWMVLGIASLYFASMFLIASYSFTGLVLTLLLWFMVGWWRLWRVTFKRY
ncbi:MAG: LptF/LptG family permease [Campylobacterales bacterium]